MDENDHNKAIDLRKPAKPAGMSKFSGHARKNVRDTGMSTKHGTFDRNTITSTLDRDDGVTSEDDVYADTGSAGEACLHSGYGLLDYVDSVVNHIADCIMIDTLDLEVPGVSNVDETELKRAFGQLDGDRNVIPDTDWAKGALNAPTGKQSLRVRHVKKTKKLLIEGSSAKHEQGQNVVSSGDVTMTTYQMCRAVQRLLKLGLPVHVGYEIVHGRLVKVTRIDVALLLRVPEGVTKAAFINALAIAGIRAGTNTSLYVNESVYFDQGSQMEAPKFYDKTAELKRARKGGLPDVDGVELLVDLNKETIRLEAVFRTKKLVQIAKAHGGAPHPCVFTKEVLAKMVLDLLSKYATQGQVFRRLELGELLMIPLPYRSTVAHWQNRMPLLDMVVSERVLKEHAKYIWDNHKIDIDGPPPDEMNVPMSLSDILKPENFMPVPAAIRSNPALFHEVDMEVRRFELQKLLDAEAI